MIDLVDMEILEHMAARFTPFPTNDPLLDHRYTVQRLARTEWPYYRFFYHLSQLLKPKLIVELGAYQGTAAGHLAAGYSKAVVIAIDHHTDPGDENNQALTRQIEDYFSNVKYVQGWTTKSLADREKGGHALGDAESAYPQVVDIMDEIGSKIDVLFIDSWHRYEEAMSDWEIYKPLLSSPALVICDDIQGGEGEHDPISGMMRFWDEMPEPKFLNSNLHPGTQMGFVQV